MRGADKLLQPVAGVPVLRHLALAALAAGAGPVAVTLPPPGTPPDALAAAARAAPCTARAATLRGLPLVLLPVPDAAEGMAASIRQAAAWASARRAPGLLLCPADMPALCADDFAALAARFSPDGPPLRAASADGRAGHPVLFPARFLPDMKRLRGDAGARELLHRHPPMLVPCPDMRALIDLDTPEDWAAWRAGRDV
ncbi:MAG: nucleotidyltransferase family protein [Pararhodobacter sp.]|nr:nucleotidyltransferase family protein [Pararhodobacter sp.]